MGSAVTERLTAGAADDADRGDPLRTYRDRFEAPDPSVCYFDGNSLGRPPVAARTVAAELIDAWSDQLVEAWEHWIDRPSAVGDLLAPLLGAAAGQVLVGESTTVALYKAVGAALRARPDRPVIVASRDDFPTDRYVVDGLASAHGRHVRWTASMDTDQLLAAIGDDVAAVVGSVVDFESAAVADVATVTAAAHDIGALVVWDCSHAAGAVPLEVDQDCVDLAVGCTYKYLHGGPGSPAFAYVAERHHGVLRQPVQGWFGQRDQFTMGPDYDPVADITAWQTGTPGMLALEVAAAGIGVVAEAGIEAVRAKSLALGQVLLDASDAWFDDLGFRLASPREDDRRGGHVALRHPEASRIVRAARAVGVVADFRAPDIVRLGPGPLATSFAEVVEGLRRLRDVVRRGDHLRLPDDPGRVT
jgi:kynureninase